MLSLQRRLMSTAASNTMREILAKQLNAIKEAGTWKTERIITSPQSDRITIQGSDKELLNFCANNYLGLSVSLCFDVSLILVLLTKL